MVTEFNKMMISIIKTLICITAAIFLAWSSWRIFGPYIAIILFTTFSGLLLWRVFKR